LNLPGSSGEGDLWKGLYVEEGEGRGERITPPYPIRHIN